MYTYVNKNIGTVACHQAYEKTAFAWFFGIVAPVDSWRRISIQLERSNEKIANTKKKISK